MSYLAKTEQWPEVQNISLNDLVEVIAAGVRDFRNAPRFGLGLSFLYVVGGWFLIALLWILDWFFLAYPLAMGFALVAPFAAVGFYAVSKQLEEGRKLSWASVLGDVRESSRRDVRWMALVTGFALVLWLDIAVFLFFGFVGLNGFRADILTSLFTTPSGIIFLIIGNLVGAMLAFGIFSISVVSFPMLFVQDVDFVTAMVTSVRLVIANPKSMIVWCAIIGALLAISVLSLFVGFFATLPVIGHSTWHLYKRALKGK